MQSRLHTILLLACLIKAMPAMGQSGAYPLIHYTTENGLSNDGVSSIAKDPQGFIWIGTANGLNRFDGRHFKVFVHDPNDENSLPDNRIKHLKLDKKGQFWISTNKGLCLLDPVKLRFRRIILPEQQDTIPNDEVGSVVFDKNGMAWFSASPGIYRMNPETMTWELIKTESSNIGYFSTYTDSRNRIWLFNRGHVHCYDQEKKAFKDYVRDDLTDPFRHATPMHLYEDENHTLWLTTWNGGLYQYDAAKDDFFQYSVPALTTAILPDTTGDGRPFFWIGGGLNGLCIFDRTTKQFYDFEPDLRNPFSHHNFMTSCFLKDHSTGDVWIGTEAGIELYSPSAIPFGRVMFPLEKMKGQYKLVTGITDDKTDPSGNGYFIGMWIDGLYRWDRRTNAFTHFDSKKYQDYNLEVFCVRQDKSGHVWSGHALGVNRYHPPTGKWEQWNKFFPKNNRINKILCMAEDQAGNMWFGSNGVGLYRFNRSNNQVEHVNSPSALAGDRLLYVSNLAIGPDGRIWLATDFGILHYNPLTDETEKIFVQGVSRNYFSSGIAVTQEGYVWAAVNNALAGLDKNGKLLHFFTKESGHLRCGQIFTVIADQRGHIWFNSDYLLHRLDPATGRFDYYGKQDGLIGNAPSDGLNILSNGEIFVGFQSGFNFFHPDRVRRNLQPPPVVITAVKVLNKEYPVESLITLKPGENMLSIEFSALNYSQPERNRYAYKLEGFDEDWIYSDRPVATYTNLDGGDYLFRVKAANNDGVWNETGAALQIKVIPPFTKRWYVQLLGIFVIIGVFASIWWYRHQQRQRLETFRESLARDLHDEMGSTLSSIRFFSEYATQQVGSDKPQVTPVLHRISESANSLSESMQDIIWAMKTKNDKLGDLAARMTEFGLRVMEARNIRFSTHISEDFAGTHLSPEQRRNIWLIFKEALNNAAKYAACTETELFLAVKKGMLLMKLQDNGKGFDADRANGGNGLQNMRLRAGEINGTLDIVSQPGEGTRVELWVRV